MSTLLEQQKRAVLDIAEAEYKKSVVVGLSALVVGGALWALGCKKTSTFVVIAGVANQIRILGKADMAAELAEKL